MFAESEAKLHVFRITGLDTGTSRKRCKICIGWCKDLAELADGPTIFSLSAQIENSGIYTHNGMRNPKIVLDSPTLYAKVKKKGKAIPLQAWTGPEGSRMLGSQISRQSAH
jgi:hypothetical protein